MSTIGNLLTNLVLLYKLQYSGATVFTVMPSNASDLINILAQANSSDIVRVPPGM